MRRWMVSATSVCFKGTVKFLRGNSLETNLRRHRRGSQETQGQGRGQRSSHNHNRHRCSQRVPQGIPNRNPQTMI
jgi:hypothetical protein